MIRKLVSAMLVIVTLALPAAAQNYKPVIESLKKLDSTLQMTKRLLAASGYVQKQYVSTDANQKADQNDILYSLVNSLDLVSAELQTALTDAQATADRMPDNVPEVKHGAVNLYGYIHQQYYQRTGDNSESDFISKRARIGAKGKLNKYTSFNFCGEFAKTPQLLDAMIQISPTRNLSFAAGQFKPPYGAEFLTSSTELPFVNTFMGKRLGTDRDIGATVSYAYKANVPFSTRWTLGLFNGAGMNTSDANDTRNVIGRAEFTFANQFTLAPNFIIGKSNDTGVAIRDINAYGGNVTWAYRGNRVQAEVTGYELDDVSSLGWYVWGARAFATHSAFLPTVELLARYEQYDADTDVDGDRKDSITLGTNLFLDGKYTKLQINYQINGEETNSIDNDEVLANLQIAF